MSRPRVHWNDAFANAQGINGSSGSVTGSNASATKETGEPNHAGDAGGHSIWYRWTAATADPVTIDTLASDFDTLLAVYTGSSVSGLNTIASNDDIVSGNPRSRVGFNPVAGITYQLAVDGFNGAAGDVTLNWNQTSPPPPPLPNGAFISFSGTNYTLRVSNSGRVALLNIPTSEWNAWAAQSIESGQVQQMSRRIYNHFQDKFDFILFISDQDNLYSGLCFRAKKDVQGIGGLFNNSPNFGSSNQLQGVIHLNAKSAFLDGPVLHEFCHQWANYLLRNIPDSGAHWGFSSAGGQLGGWQYGTLTSVGGGVYQADGPKRDGSGFGTYWNGAVLYSELELYLMGLIGPNEVMNPIQIASNAAFIISEPGRFTASSIQTISITNIINTEGSRVPSYLNSQKSFRTMVVVLTKAPISDSRLAAYEADVAEFSFAGNDSVSYRYNFSEATGGRATMQMDGLVNELKQPPALQITNLVENQSGQMSFQWLSIGGIRYRVQFGNGNLSEGFQDIVRSAAQEVSPAPDGGIANMTFTDDSSFTGGSPQQGQRFYRVRVVSP